ncbi:MAG TPA: class I SAM-dependent methyltransferase [Patescibacteria group bacterium]|nr:class I SAM-dependent methyltransferase [Patescibacteria group bacterium]
MKTIHLDDIRQKEDLHWWHVAKKELIVSIIKNIIESNSYTHPKILEIGAGTGTMLKNFITIAEVTALDISKQALHYCKTKGIRNLIHADLETYQDFKHNYYDIIICCDLLEHIQNDEKALKKINSMLKKKGTCILHVPANQKLYSYWDKFLGHYRRYEIKQLKNKLEHCGFRVNFISYRVSFLFPFAFLFRKYKNLFQKNSSKISSDFFYIPFLNTILFFITKIEDFLIIRSIIRPSFGLSIIAIVKKK